MKKIIINEYFKHAYLTCGNTRDNFIFENCPIEFMIEAKELLAKNSNGVKSCVVKITRKEEKKIEETLSQFEHDMQRKLIARDYISSIIMLEVLRGIRGKGEEIAFIKKGVSAIKNNNYWKVREYDINSPKPNDISYYVRKFGKIELNIFLVDTHNKYIQHAINNLIASREPYSIKVFTNSKFLPSYVDDLGTPIECPHDYMRVNVNNFIELVDEL